MADNLSFAVAFGAGFLSFVSPCVLPLVPVYLAHLAGSGVAVSQAPPRTTTLFHALAFVLGFSAVFVALGSAVGLLGAAVSDYMPVLRKVAGAVLILLGLHLTRLFKFNFLEREFRIIRPLTVFPGYLRSFLVGALFSIGWIPCVGPLLGSILALAGSSETAWAGAYYLAVYSAGLGLPFLLAGLALSTTMGVLRRLNRYLGLVSIISGGLVIAIGVLLLTNTLVRVIPYFDF